MTINFIYLFHCLQYIFESPKIHFIGFDSIGVEVFDENTHTKTESEADRHPKQQEEQITLNFNVIDLGFARTRIRKSIMKINNKQNACRFTNSKSIAVNIFI